MKSAHRVVNNIGYKRLYPLIGEGDNSICQYCGRSGSSERQITDDHVPPLNVKIPEDYVKDVRKCLIRACSECNSLAGDKPHMDFWERHYWLKGAYIRRYHKLLISEGVYSTREDQDDSLRLMLENIDTKYKNVLLAIGFGLKDIDEIESPFLKTKTKSGKSIKALIIEHIHGLPKDDEYEDDQILHFGNDINPIVELNMTEEHQFFIDFIHAEMMTGEYIDCQASYAEWCNMHPTRFNSLGLPDDPESELNATWNQINEQVKIKMNKT